MANLSAELPMSPRHPITTGNPTPWRYRKLARECRVVPSRCAPSCNRGDRLWQSRGRAACRAPGAAWVGLGRDSAAVLPRPTPCAYLGLAREPAAARHRDRNAARRVSGRPARPPPVAQAGQSGAVSEAASLFLIPLGWPQVRPWVRRPAARAVREPLRVECAVPQRRMRLPARDANSARPERSHATRPTLPVRAALAKVRWLQQAGCP